MSREEEAWKGVPQKEREEAERRSAELDKAIERLRWVVAQDSGASPGAERVLRFAIHGRAKDKIELTDLLRLDDTNRRAALRVIEGALLAGPLSNFDHSI